MRRDRGGIEREGAQDIVRAVVTAGFVDRKDLHGSKAVSGRPFDRLAKGLGVTDAKIVPATQREERDEKTGDFLFGVEGHG